MRCTRLLILIIGLAPTSVSTALATEDRRIEGTVKAVDAEKSTVTLTTKDRTAAKDETLDVVKKARITVNGGPAALKDVRRGQQAVATFNTELEVVTKLDATGEGVAPLVPETTFLNELPEADVDHTGPWPTADGLTLYWKTRPRSGGGQSWIWSARRKTKDGLFEDARRLVPGSDMTVSADGLEMVLLQGVNLWATTRPSVDAAFIRPQKVAEFQDHGFISVPCLSGNDLVLYADRFFPNQPVGPVKSTRANRRAKWSAPVPVKVAIPAGKRARFFSVTPDGSRAFCVLFDVGPVQPNGNPPRVTGVLATMRAQGDGFSRPEVIKVNGEVLRGIFPRYVAATNELFYVRQEEGKPAGIALVRDFDPDAIETTPVAAARPTRPDREAIQGEWALVSETIAGNPLTPEQIGQLNKVLSIRGNRLRMSRTGLAGQFRTYDGTFRLDPTAQPRAFDWSGKRSDGAVEGWKGVYQLDGDVLRLCYVDASDGKPRPTEVRSTRESGGYLGEFKRRAK